MAMYFVLKIFAAKQFREGTVFFSQSYNSSLGKRALQSKAANTAYFSVVRDGSSSP